MAKVFLTNLNLKGNQLLNAVIQPLTSNPSGTAAGQIYYNTSSNLLYTYNGTTWNPVNGGIITGASTFYGVTTLAGTSNQITLTPSGSTPSGTVTFSIPSAFTFPGTATLSSGNTLTLGASTTAGASLNMPAGSAPTSPNTGDAWLTSSGLNIRYGATPANHTLADLDSTQTLTNKTLTSPSLTTPNIGSAGANFAGSTSGTTTLAASATASGTLTLPATTDTLVGAAFTQTLTNKTLTSPILTTPAIGSGGFTLAGSTSGTISVVPQTGIVSGTITIPSVASTDTVALGGLAQTLTNKTLTAPTINGGTHTAITSLGIRDTSAAFDVTLAASSSVALTAGRTLTLDLQNAARTVSLAGNISLAGNLNTAGAFTTAGAFGLTLTATNTTNATIPAGTVTLVDLASSQALTGKTYNGLSLTSNATGFSIAGGTTSKTLTANNSLTLAGTDSTTITFPSANLTFSLPSAVATTLVSPNTGTVNLADVSTAQALTNKTISGLTVSTTTGTLTIPASTIAFSGANNVTLTSTAATSLTLPTTGTLATLAGTETLTNKTLTTATLGSALAAGGFKITGLADPTSAQDAATKAYVDASTQGLNVHDAVRLATTANLTATYAAGTSGADGGLGVGATLTNSGTQAALVIDTKTVVVGDRILVKNQTTATQNGLYTVTVVGTGSTNWVLTRAVDADNHIAGQVLAGDFVFVSDGAANLATGYVESAQGTSTTPNNGIKIGTDNIAYTQFSGTGTYTASNGVLLTGTNFTFAPLTNGGLQTASGGASILLPANSGLSTTSSGLAVGVGTGLTVSGSTVSYSTGTTTQTGSGITGGAFTYATQKQVATITGNGTLTSFAVNHNLNSQDMTVQVYQTSATPDTQYSEVEVDIVRTSTSVVTVTFAVAPASSVTYNVVMVG
jgi:hypothetical protein